MNAIDALNDNNRSNKSSISKHIEATYGNLSTTYSTLLFHHLNKMKAIRNNYLKLGPGCPLHSGSPLKPKTPLPPSTILSLLRPRPHPHPRGRPPKILDPNDPLPPPKRKSAPSPAASFFYNLSYHFVLYKFDQF
ncbi:unnamed protein product [Fraxinus pennsylvanica]|uniref:Uncharacterized protein n=1 Tax=Fraxinus pennsylvanica TaxID=56036 RepID=A0AAD1Z8F9_9LAMI|nr:unnamed protein product [Fraxinus pennsylvanica]